MDKTIFNSFRLTVAEKNLGVYGVIVRRKDGDSIEHRWRANDKVCLYSGSKTFTSMAVGICRDEGRLELTDKVIDFFPEYRHVMSEGSGDITLRDLLHMASGKGVFWFSADEKAMLEKDYAELFFTDPQVCAPGSAFFYSNACTYMLARVVEAVSGEKLRDYLVPRLFTPLGIHNPQWHMCPRGHTLGATALFLTTDEYSRLGQMLLGSGVYGDKRIVSEAYVKLATTDDVIENKDFEFADPESKAGYGYQIWRCTREHAYRADGMYGQFSIVLEDKDAVVTVTSHNETNANDILRAVFADIAPQL